MIVSWMTTNRCNLHCRHCYSRSENRSYENELNTEEGRGIIISSHDLPLSFTVSDTVCLMKNGHIGAAGTPEELAGKPDLMREITGACLIPSGQAESLYKYQLSR